MSGVSINEEEEEEEKEEEDLLIASWMTDEN